MSNISFLAIGDELLDGRVLNTNQQWVSNQLITHIGRGLSRAYCYPDDVVLLSLKIQQLAKESSVLLICGGLGPTTDDCTRDAVSRAINQPLVRNDNIVLDIQQRFDQMNKPMPEINRRQANIPNSATIIENDHGTAPGFYVSYADCLIVCLPGVPRELKPMVSKTVIPLLTRVCLDSGIPSFKIEVYKCFGIGESSLAEKIESILPKIDDVDVLYRAHFPELHVTLRLPAADQYKTEWLHWKKRFESMVMPWVFSRGADDYIDAVMAWLNRHHHKLVLAESCTGGMVTQLITAKPGASSVLMGGVVSYANSMKEQFCAVDSQILASEGAVSESCALAMAAGMLQQCSDATIAISITGIAGPDGGSADKPVGRVCCAVVTANGQQAITWNLSGSRERIRVLSSYHALSFMMNDFYC